MRRSRAVVILTMALGFFVGAQSAVAQTESILYNFKSGTKDGAYPISGLTQDSSGNFYGTTYEGGAHGKGTVYKLSESGSSWTDSVLWNFGIVLDGAYPEASPFIDSDGVLWGTTVGGGLVSGAAGCTSGCGTFYTLADVAGEWVESPLFSFPPGNAGYNPVTMGHLIQDSNGNFYGTAVRGGAHGSGVVFELTLGNGGTTETVLYSFDSDDRNSSGVTPEGALVIDGSGNLYGTTTEGGSNRLCNDAGCGTVYELSPPVPPSTTWTETIIHTFQGGVIDGSGPVASLIFDSTGDLYGTTTSGGLYGDGTAFELSPSVGGGWTETKIFNFGSTASDGRKPECSLVMDSNRNLYGTTIAGGSGYGTVFKLTPDIDTWTETILHSFAFSRSDGEDPVGGLLMDSSGNLYGTTEYGGTNLYGTVFKVVP